MKKQRRKKKQGIIKSILGEFVMFLIELLEEIEYAIKHPFQFIFVMGTITGLLPCFIMAIVEKIIF